MRRNKLPRIALAVFLSICLWLYVVTVVDPNDSKTIYGVTVNYESLETLSSNSLIMTTGRNATVNLKFSGRRSELKQLTNESVTVTADVSRVNTEGEQNLSYSVNLPDSVSSSDVSLVDKNPSRLNVNVERASEKELEVEVDIVNEVAEGFVADVESMTMDPKTITVFGPAKVVDQIEKAQVTLDVGQVTDTVDSTFPFKLLDENGNAVNMENVTCSEDAVNVMLPVKKFKEIPLQLNVKEGGGAKEDNVKIDLSPAFITISGSAAAVDSMDALVLGDLDLSTLTSNATSQTYEIVLPEGITNVSGETQVVAQITLVGLAETTLDVENFKLENTPGSLQAVVKTTVLQITLRGPSEQIDALTPEDLTVTADLSKFKKSGTYTIPVTVTSSQYPDVGAVGGASITVSIE